VRRGARRGQLSVGAMTRCKPKLPYRWRGVAVRFRGSFSRPPSTHLRGVARRQTSARSILPTQLHAILSALEVLPFEPPADTAYGELRAQLELASQPIGGNDLLIAAQAVALGYTIVTDNEREFRRIQDLPCENWLRE